MAFHKNEIESVQRENQATPLANQFLELLSGQISSGEIGAGVGPLQRQAGTAAQQFVNSGGGQFDISPLFKALQAQTDRGTTSGLRDLREGFGIAGNRFGTGFGAGQAQFSAQRQADLDALFGNLSLDTFNAEQSRLLESIGLLGDLGTQNLAPFVNLAGRGILEPELAEKKGLFGTIGDIAGGVAGGITGVGSVLDAIQGFGGGGDQSFVNPQATNVRTRSTRRGF